MTSSRADAAEVARRERAAAALRARILACRSCSDVDAAVVAGLPGAGSLFAPVVLVGESPARQQDPRTDRPFAGGSGRLLDDALALAGLTRDEVFITNAVHCRLPGNRDPGAGELTAHLPLLRDELALVAPRLVIGLGRFAAEALRTGYPVAETRWPFRRPRPGTDPPLLVCAPHPAYVTRFRHREQPGYIRALAAALAWGFDPPRR